MFSEEIRQNLLQLEQMRATGVDPHFSSSELQCLQNVHVEQECAQFDFFGPADDLSQNELQSYLMQMGDNETDCLEGIARLMYRLSKEVQIGFDAEAVWTMVRITMPNEEFAVPRWHPDGKYFSSKSKQYKFVTTLKGARTLFGEARDPSAVRRLLRATQDLCTRRAIAQLVDSKRFDGRQGVLYLVGEDNAVLHSEPYMQDPRIFLSILPGSKAQIQEWQRIGA